MTIAAALLFYQKFCPTKYICYFCGVTILRRMKQIIRRLTLVSAVAIMAAASMQGRVMGSPYPAGYVGVDGKEFVIRGGEAYFCGSFNEIPSSLTVDGHECPIVGLYAGFFTPSHSDHSGRWQPDYYGLEGYIGDYSSVAKIAQQTLFRRFCGDHRRIRF